MAGVLELEQLLAGMAPQLQPGEFVFCCVEGDYNQYAELQPLASFVEREGLTLVLPIAAADAANIGYEGVFRQITLTVHSSLQAVGLTAAVSQKLTSVGISANVIAAYYHDHVFVPVEYADAAVVALRGLAQGQ